ncbi:MAG: hypothetical protein CMD88_00900 [Gammaproteobacteria bacterium]|nr:hypothetical protein [Gammaproteobacteria bacterium]|tara:strand:+ start:92947 stop:93537 length:591 start_codon:yes stop_codon:yes gene_type:complete
MNPLLSIKGTIISGFILTIILTLIIADGAIPIEAEGYLRWFHYLSGITWIGLLYYFNFVQVPAMAQATADKDPGPAAIGKYVAPLALLWFRWGAVVTWVTGAAYLAHHGQFVAAFTLAGGYSTVIGTGAWLGTIMFFNVWVLIWPNQQKVLGLVEATDEEKAKAKKIALLASRTNTVLSIPMLLFMGASHHPGLTM